MESDGRLEEISSIVNSAGRMLVSRRQAFQLLLQGEVTIRKIRKVDSYGALLALTHTGILQLLAASQVAGSRFLLFPSKRPLREFWTNLEVMTLTASHGTTLKECLTQVVERPHLHFSRRVSYNPDASEDYAKTAAELAWAYIVHEKPNA